MIERLLLGVFLLSFATSTRARGGGKIAMGFVYQNRPFNSIFTTAKLIF